LDKTLNTTSRKVMKKARSSFKVGLLAAGIAATTMASAGNGVVTAKPNQIAQTAPATQAVQAKRTPVIALTRTMGDVGFEIFDGQTKRYTLASLPKDATDAIVYIDVDSVEMNRKKMKAVLDLARDLNWVVMAESGSWNVPRLHAFVAAYAPEAKTQNLQNVAVRIAWDNGRAVATDLAPDAAAVEVGIDYAQTSAGKALLANTFMTKTIAPGSNYAWFANNAYQATASNRQEGTRFYSVALDRDVVKVWKSTSNGTTDCVVAWRGSSTAGDWLVNIENQFGSAVAVPGESSSNGARIGSGYATRLSNYKAAVDAIACNNVYRVTGHSLGGGMAEAYAFTIRSKAPNLEAYNPARVGNASLRTQLVSALGTAKVEVFCRNLDPVWAVPVGLEHVGSNNGCTYWGAYVSILNPVANHAMNLWL
jgi:Lipase (class 3)